MESPEVLTMHAMSWQRAKGELHAMLATYWPVVGGLGAGGPEQAASAEHDLRECVRDFIATVEEKL